MRIVYILLILILTYSLSPAKAQETQPIAPTLYTYSQVSDQSLEASVFNPAIQRDNQKPASAILLFHGGGWSVGSPEWVFGAARRFASHGMVAIAVQYRLSKGAVTPIEALQDVCEAFRWVHKQANSLKIDPNRIAGYGVSAGGHLVASTVTIGCNDEASAAKSGPDALLLWSPALDMGRDGWFERKLQNRATAEAYSPVEHVQQSTPPTSIVQGDKDTLTPLSGAKKYCEQLLQQGTQCDLNVYKNVGHLLTRNLDNQENNFDPDPEAVADGITSQLKFLRKLGFIQ